MKKDILIVIPAFNEEKTIESTVSNLKECGYNNILVVDDGSSDRTSEIASKLGVFLVRHLINRGAGLASATGFEIAKILNPEIVVTFDADGQHNAADIEKLVAPILKDETDVVIGSRMLSKSGMPFKRRIYNKIANMVTFIFYGVLVSDTQSGLKAFNRKAYNLIDIEQARMEFCSEIIYKIHKNNLRYKEIAIRPFYTKYSLSKGQGFIVGIKTFIRLLLSKLARRK